MANSRGPIRTVAKSSTGSSPLFLKTLHLMDLRAQKPSRNFRCILAPESKSNPCQVSPVVQAEREKVLFVFHASLEARNSTVSSALVTLTRSSSRPGLAGIQSGPALARLRDRGSVNEVRLSSASNPLGSRIWLTQRTDFSLAFPGYALER